MLIVFISCCLGSLSLGCITWLYFVLLVSDKWLAEEIIYKKTHNVASVVSSPTVRYRECTFNRMYTSLCAEWNNHLMYSDFFKRFMQMCDLDI